MKRGVILANSPVARKKAVRQMNISKVTGYAITINALQILAVSSLALYSILYDIHLTGWLARSLILSTSLMVIWGAVLDIREALNARRNAAQKQALEEAYEQLEELNSTLRAQRHDFMNHIQVIYTLTELDDRPAALEYMDKVYGDIQKVGRVLKTTSPAVNALIAAKMEIPIFGPTPDTVISFKKSSFSLGSANPNRVMPSSFTCK